MSERSASTTRHDDDRRQKLTELQRKQRCREIWEPYRLRVQQILNRSVSVQDLVGVDETDRVWNLLISRDKLAGLPARFHRKYPASSGPMLFGQLASDNTTAGLEMFLLDRVTRVCGAMRIPSELALEQAQPLLELDGDDLYLCTPDLSEGIILSMIEDVIEGTPRQLIEVTVWGGNVGRSIEQKLLNVLG